MCGIVGVAGNLMSREELTMKRLLLVDTLRGFDSTGLAAVRCGGSMVYVAKRAKHCFDLFDTKSFQDALNGISSQVFIGHNRAATIGGIKDVNAHPFQIEHITGVHNGTLEDRDKSMLEDIAGEKFNTDSEALFAAIAKVGVKEVIPKITKGCDQSKGAWSLVWWDANDKTLNFLRNDHRPLWYCFSDDFKLIFWASENWMLDCVLQKYGTYNLYKQESKQEPGKQFRFFQTQVDTHYSIDIAKLKQGSKERPKMTAAKLPGKEPEEAAPAFPFGVRPSQSGGTGSSGGPRNGVTTTHINTRTTTGKQTSHGKKSTLSASLSIMLEGDLLNPYAGYFNKQKFYFLGQQNNHGHKGCSMCGWCHKAVPYGQPGITVFTRDNILVCADCSGTPLDMQSTTADAAAATRIYVPRQELLAYQGR